MTEETKAALKALELYNARHPRPSHVTITQAAESGRKGGGRG